jgi:hypothetical protein
MRFFFIAILLNNICLAQFRVEWTKPVKLPNPDDAESRFYTYTDHKIFLLEIHDFYKTDINKNGDGSITVSIGKRVSSDSFQKATIYELDRKDSLQIKKQFDFSPRYAIKQFIVPAEDVFVVYGAEHYILGKGSSFIKNWGNKNDDSIFDFNAFSSSHTNLVFPQKKEIGIIGFQYGHPVNHPVFMTIALSEKKVSSYSPDSVYLDNFFECSYANEKYYIAGNCRIHTDSTDKSPPYSRLLVFDKTGQLQLNEVCQLDDSLHRFDVRQLSVLNDETVICGMLYSRDYKNREQSWVLESIKKGERSWIQNLPANYNPASLSLAGNHIIIVALEKKNSGGGYTHYHLLRYDKSGQLKENMILENMKPEWKNIQVFYTGENFLLFSGKNIFNYNVIEKISF